MLADQYDIAPLKQLALDKIKDKACGWDAEFMRSQDAGMAQIISLAYGAFMVTKEIREAIINKILDLGTLSTKPVPGFLEDAIATHAKFAIDLVDAAQNRRTETTATTKLGESRVQCSGWGCTHEFLVQRSWDQETLIWCTRCGVNRPVKRFADVEDLEHERYYYDVSSSVNSDDDR